MKKTIHWTIQGNPRSSIRELLKYYNSFNLPTLKELGLGIFLYYGTKALNTPVSLSDVYDQGLVIHDGPRLTHERIRVSLSEYYLRHEHYRCLFMALKTTTLCIMETPFFTNVSMPLAVYPEDVHFTEIFAGFQSRRQNCDFCQIRNALRFNMSRYVHKLMPEVAASCISEPISNCCRECLEVLRKQLEQIDENQLQFILGRPCVRLNVKPDIMDKLFPHEEPYGVKEDEDIRIGDSNLSFNFSETTSEKLWNSFLADYLAALCNNRLKGIANQNTTFSFLTEEEETLAKEPVDIDCILLQGKEPRVIIETFSGGSLSRYHEFHMLRKFRAFTLAQTATPQIKCVYIHFGKGKTSEDYKAKIATFHATGHVYIQLEEHYSQLERFYQKREPVEAAQLRALYRDVLEKICRTLEPYLKP